MRQDLPLGIRNNNPGNIELGAPWQGLADEQTHSRFAQFKAPEWGIRAIARVLITYQDKRRARDGSKIDTVAEIIDRWAPSAENDTSSYAAHVRQTMGLVDGETVDVRDYETMYGLVVGIIKHENGIQPYSETEIRKGLTLAGIEVSQKPLSQSRTIKRAGVAGAAAAAAPVIDQVSDALEKASGAAPLVQQLMLYSPWVLAVVGVIAAIWVIKARVEDNKVRF
jgi:hypothetical protein